METRGDTVVEDLEREFERRPSSRVGEMHGETLSILVLAAAARSHRGRVLYLRASAAIEDEHGLHFARELVLLVHRDHSDAFWQKLGSTMPDWAERKALLEAWEVGHRAV